MDDADFMHLAFVFFAIAREYKRSQPVGDKAAKLVHDQLVTLAWALYPE